MHNEYLLKLIRDHMIRQEQVIKEHFARNERIRKIKERSAQAIAFEEASLEENNLKTPRPRVSETGYKLLEHYGVETSVSDADMLELHIEIALANGDKEAFMVLTKQLQEVGK